ncbi:MAG: phosphopantetheine-binding protein, partial [Gammaproteobacteria bacterium]
SWTDWREGRPCVEELRRRLTEERPPLFALRRIANARVEEALGAVEPLLRGGRSGPVGDIKVLAASSARAGLEPEDLWRLAGECSYRADLSFAEGSPDGSFDAVFRPLAVADWEPSPTFAPDQAAQPWSRYANNPLHEKLARRIVPELREFLKEKLPHYMLPSHFTLLPNLPLTPAGKVDRLALPPPDFSARVADQAYVAPRGPEEQVLASIWADILGLSRVGIHNNFFELGGHSLKATQVVSRIQRELGAEVPLRDLFNHPTIAELAPRLLVADAAAYVAIPKAPDAEHYPLSHAQRRLWVLSQLDGASAAYNMPMALLLEGPIDGAAFDRAYARLIERH